jgi:sRNA-binding regulator protein Hfq
MSFSPLQPPPPPQGNPGVRRPSSKVRRNSSGPIAVHFAARMPEFETPQHHAELFYLQKQIQSQTPMVIVLEDGEHVEGCIEWYDRNTLKVRGRTRTLVYKSAVKYMYKLGDVG